MHYGERCVVVHEVGAMLPQDVGQSPPLDPILGNRDDHEVVPRAQLGFVTPLLPTMAAMKRAAGDGASASRSGFTIRSLGAGRAMLISRSSIPVRDPSTCACRRQRRTGMMPTLARFENSSKYRVH